ncbi:unnamed protein product [Owenia fusiformis]|uniref:Uncharacterized protein n=1 Tax=Owenia fusiformis TaxID=6347 RepID=A0A8J1UW83_OWEFU|nr:unnamed protein product [Owenia fusiformis]
MAGYMMETRELMYGISTMENTGNTTWNLSMDLNNSSYRTLEMGIYNALDYKDAIKGAVLTLLALVGTCTNTFILMAIVPNSKLHNVTNVLVCHLGVLGLLSSVIMLPLYASTSFNITTVFQRLPLLCQIHGFISSLIVVATIWNITALSWDKYQAISHPLQHTTISTKKRLTAWICVLWIFTTLLCLPPLIPSGNITYTFHPYKTACEIDFSNYAGVWYSVVYMILAFFAPMVIMLYCHSHLFKIARTHSQMIVTMHLVSVLTVVQAPVTAHTKGKIRTPVHAFRGKRAMGTIVQLITTFIVTYTPYCIVVAIEMATSKETNYYLVVISTILLYAAPCTNAFAYGIKNRILRQSFKNFVTKIYQKYTSKKHVPKPTLWQQRRKSSSRTTSKKTPSSTNSKREQMRMENGCIVGPRSTATCPNNRASFDGAVGPHSNIDEYIPLQPAPGIRYDLETSIHPPPEDIAEESEYDFNKNDTNSEINDVIGYDVIEVDIEKPREVTVRYKPSLSPVPDLPDIDV